MVYNTHIFHIVDFGNTEYRNDFYVNCTFLFISVILITVQITKIKEEVQLTKGHAEIQWRDPWTLQCTEDPRYDRAQGGGQGL